MIRKIDISHRTIIFTAIFILSLWLTYQILDLIMLLFISIILMSALSPVISFFGRFRVPKALAILLSYIIIIGIFGGIVASFVPPLIEQSTKLINTLPSLITDTFKLTRIDQNIIQSQASNLSKNIFTFTLAIFDNIITLIFLLVITFYLLLDKERLEKKIAELFIGKEERVKGLISKVEDKLGAWLRGQLTLTIIIGAVVYIGLTILNIPYALPLALLAGVMEIVPVIGPIISAIPAVIIAVTISPALAAGVAAMYFLIQQLENHLIVPQIMKRAVGINPLVVILAVAVGGRLLGVGGALLAVPIAVVLEVILLEFLKEYKTVD